MIVGQINRQTLLLWSSQQIKFSSNLICWNYSCANSYVNCSCYCESHSVCVYACGVCVCVSAGPLATVPRRSLSNYWSTVPSITQATHDKTHHHTHHGLDTHWVRCAMHNSLSHFNKKTMPTLFELSCMFHISFCFLFSSQASNCCVLSRYL